MKCFIHFNQEAIAACTKCGKGMCANCSAYSGHSGICPECRKVEFQQQVASLNEGKQENIWKIVKWSFLAIFVVTIPFSAGFIIYNAFQIKKANERIAYLEGEIIKLSKATSRGNANI